MFFRIELRPHFKNVAIDPSEVFFFFNKYFLKPCLKNAAIDIPRVVFMRNTAILLSITACFKHGSRLNKFFFFEKDL